MPCDATNDRVTARFLIGFVSYLERRDARHAEPPYLPDAEECNASAYGVVSSYAPPYASACALGRALALDPFDRKGAVVIWPRLIRRSRRIPIWV